ncbi:MAG: hypothetical protein AAB214_10685 [Fibrobacterota bacterium]
MSNTTFFGNMPWIYETFIKVGGVLFALSLIAFFLREATPVSAPVSVGICWAGLIVLGIQSKPGR